MNVASDNAVRAQALDPQGSYLVQAPAGSGKTELLTQRFLALLGVAERPESILAMTFTRKAASEMRGRIMQHLRWAAAHPQADAGWPAHEQRTWDLARKALARDAERGWHLLDHPARLRIHTIDAFCSSLVAQMPYLSRLGGMAHTAEDAGVLYHEAARATVQALDDADGETAEALFHVLGALDNQRSRLQALVAEMLARRDQWVRHIRPAADDNAFREDLESVLRELAQEEAERFLALHGETWLQELEPLLAYARQRFADAGTEHAISAITHWPDFANPGPEAATTLKAVAAWLLTKGGSLRKTLTVNDGFPPSGTHDGCDAKASKQAMQALLDSLREHDGFDIALARFTILPDTRIPDSEWQFFRSLRRILVHALACLKLVFREQGELDFSEIALSALQALGDENEPTDLAIRKDQQIHHLLVDEFQDTSHTQFELLRRLMREWQPGDGRTAFLVGDPMQSIYRFREGDVGLFLRVREHGFGHPDDIASLRPQFLELSANFRSDAGIVDWVNTHFAQVFPAEEDMALGAIAYAPSTATRAPLEAEPVCIHAFRDDDGSAEAETVARIVLSCQARHPEEDIAILVRARSHLQGIAAALHRHGLPFQAVDIEPLAEKQVIEDLLALTRALLHPADREAWLAILRAPWCALRLTELETLLAGTHHTVTVWECLQQASRWQDFSAPSRQRLQAFIAVMQAALFARSRQTLRERVEAAWIALGGPAVLLENSGYDDAEAFFRLLETLQGEAADVAVELPEALGKLYAAANAEPQAARIKLMTIHASKGLQFDTVILPALHKTGRRDNHRLLHWQEFTLRDSDALLIAPLDSGEESSGLYRFLEDFEKQKAHYEMQRLLYVAATRARNRLHLLGNCSAAEEGDEAAQARAPARDSLLAPLWPMLHTRFHGLASSAPDDDVDSSGFVPQLAALRPEWALPETPPETAISTPARTVLQPYTAGEPDHGRIVGTLVHAYLELIHRSGLASWDRERTLGLEPAINNRLIERGVGKKFLDRALARVMQALLNALSDNTGRWLLDNRHEDSRAELELYFLEAQATTTHIVDRTFIEQGMRWIVDYKTDEPAKGQDLDAFLATRKAEYREQLERYAALFAQQETRPISLMLYFPLLPAEVRWEYGA